MAFRFTGLEQLRLLNVGVPPQLIEEIGRSSIQMDQNEERNVNSNLQRANQPRPNFVPRQDPSQQQGPTQPSPTPPPLTPAPQTAGYPTVPNPLVPPPHVLQQPPPNISPSSNVQQPPNPSENLSHPRPHSEPHVRENGSTPSKYQRPSYSPSSFPAQRSSFLVSPPASSAQSRFPVSSPAPGSERSTPRSRLWNTNFNTVNRPMYF